MQIISAQKEMFLLHLFLQSHNMFHTESYITECKQLTPWDRVHHEKQRTPHQKKKKFVIQCYIPDVCQYILSTQIKCKQI